MGPDAGHPRLDTVEGGVAAAAADQFLMRTVFDHPPLLARLRALIATDRLGGLQITRST